MSFKKLTIQVWKIRKVSSHCLPFKHICESKAWKETIYCCKCVRKKRDFVDSELYVSGQPNRNMGEINWAIFLRLLNHFFLWNFQTKPGCYSFWMLDQRPFRWENGCKNFAFELNFYIAYLPFHSKLKRLFWNSTIRIS